MFDPRNPFTFLLLQPIVNILIAIYQGVLALHISYPLGFAIILLTILIRLILYPLTSSSLKASQKMQKIAPHVNKLKEKHKNDPKMLQQQTMQLYKEHGVNPVASCLPTLIQIPLLYALFQVLNHVVSTKPQVLLTELNKILYFPSLHLHTAIDQNFFGLPLGKSPHSLLSTYGVAILLTCVITVALQFIQSKMMFSTAKKNTDQKEVAKGKDGKEQKKSDEDMTAAMQSQMLYILPFFIGLSSFNFALGLSLYWNTNTIFGIIQQYQVMGLGGLQDWINRFKKN